MKEEFWNWVWTGLGFGLAALLVSRIPF